MERGDKEVVGNEQCEAWKGVDHLYVCLFFFLFLSSFFICSSGEGNYGVEIYIRFRFLFFCLDIISFLLFFSFLLIFYMTFFFFLY
jgi:hypothetical protein